MEFNIVRIQKGKSKKFRLVFLIAKEDRDRLRLLLPQLENILKSVDSLSVNYAFEKGKNCALNAIQHVGYRYNLSIDLKDFFDHVRPDHVSDLIPETLISQCFIDGHPRQGLPTSPLIATISFIPCDKKIIQMLGALKIDAVYTRYADDLIFSFNKYADGGRIKTIVRQVVEESGFEINDSKTKFQDSKNGRIIINGIAVDKFGIHATRNTKRKIRAALHQQNFQSLKGLVQWSKCKLPKQVGS
jgi:hypothetical protein